MFQVGVKGVLQIEHEEELAAEVTLDRPENPNPCDADAKESVNLAPTGRLVH